MAHGVEAVGKTRSGITSQAPVGATSEGNDGEPEWNSDVATTWLKKKILCAAVKFPRLSPWATGISPLRGSYLLPPAHCLLPTAYCFLPSAYCFLPSAYCFLPSAYCFLPSAYCFPPSAYCFPPSAFCFLPTAFCLAPGRQRPDKFRTGSTAAAQEIRPRRQQGRSMSRKSFRRRLVMRSTFHQFRQTRVGLDPNGQWRGIMQALAEAGIALDALPAIGSDHVGARGSEFGGGRLRRGSHHGAVKVLAGSNARETIPAIPWHGLPAHRLSLPPGRS